jgi:hypothetical protein
VEPYQEAVGVMAKISQDALRLDILREAIDRYNEYNSLLHVTNVEYTMNALKIMECEAMVREIMQVPD